MVRSGTRHITAGVLPEGRYAFLTLTGPYKGLREACGALLAWIEEEGLVLDKGTSPRGDTFGCRLEIYPTDPKLEKDRQKYVTELAFRLAD